MGLDVFRDKKWIFPDSVSYFLEIDTIIHEFVISYELAAMISNFRENDFSKKRTNESLNFGFKMLKAIATIHIMHAF